MKRRVIRPEDALRHLTRAVASAPGSPQQRQHLENANWVHWAGLVNRDYFGESGDRRQGKRRHDDTSAHELMRHIAKATGETRKLTLARMAVESGKVALHGAQPESVIRRLARTFCTDK